MTAEGIDGVQYCAGPVMAYEWGPCIEQLVCEPGAEMDCGLCDGEEDCEFEGIADRCSLHDGVPGWDCDSAADFEDCACNTPLVLQFAAAPVKMVAAATATFDIDGIGACLTTDWPTAETPWLALDVNGDGTIDSGRELFGSGTRLQSGGRARNGFMALAELDSDGNGRIDRHDARFGELVVWADEDFDKRGTLGETVALPARGIVAIELQYRVERQCDARGNCGVERASFSYVGPGGVLAEGEVVDLHLACQ